MARPKKETIQNEDKYVIRFPDGMRDALKDAAKENNRSLNAEIISRLETTMLPDHYVYLSDILDQVSVNISKLRKGIASSFYEDELSNETKNKEFTFFILFVLATLQNEKLNQIEYFPNIFLSLFKIDNKKQFDELAPDFESCLEYMVERRLIIYFEEKDLAYLKLGEEGILFLSKVWSTPMKHFTVGSTLQEWLKKIQNKPLPISLDDLDARFIIFSKKELGLNPSFSFKK